MKRTDQRRWHEISLHDLRSSFLGPSRVHWSKRLQRFGRLRNADEIVARGEFPTPQDWIDAFYGADSAGADSAVTDSAGVDFNRTAWLCFAAFLALASGVRLLR